MTLLSARSFALPLVLVTVACGGSPQEPARTPPAASAPAATRVAEPVEAVETASPAEQESQPPELLAEMPGAICEQGSTCTPPEAFAKAVCRGRYPGLAIALFEKSTPWPRRYVKVASIDPVNTYGGGTSQPLEFTEEVLILRHQGQEADGMVISGASDVDVLRWDGTCATVREEFLSQHMMPTIKNATVTWRYLDPAIQEALLESKYVNIRYSQQRKACRASSTSNPGSSCAKASDNLNDAITVAVRGGLELPTPQKLPKWKAPDDDQRTAALADPE